MNDLFRKLFLSGSWQMAWRVRFASLKTALAGGVDIVMTHAPVSGYGDLPDLPHQGFECFNTLLDNYSPRYFLHGHIHRSYGVKIPQITQHGDTTVVNAFEYCELNI